MRKETINNKQTMKIGLINENYKLDAQLEVLKPISDTLIYFNNDDMQNILKYIRDGDSLYILSYALINDEISEAMNFKFALDDRKIRIDSIKENTMDTPTSMYNLTYGLFCGTYELSSFIMENRIKMEG